YEAARQSMVWTLFHYLFFSVGYCCLIFQNMDYYGLVSPWGYKMQW
ncbi:hypothetical protein J530_4921, partial [Acinetobacter baumannii 15827]